MAGEVDGLGMERGWCISLFCISAHSTGLFALGGTVGGGGGEDGGPLVMLDLWSELDSSNLRFLAGILNTSAMGSYTTKVGLFPLRGQCHEIFDFRCFPRVIFSLAPDNPSSAISKFIGNSRRYSKLMVHQHDTGSKLTTGVVDTGGKFTLVTFFVFPRYTIYNLIAMTPILNIDNSNRLPTL
jgi:hypothetical protein